MNERVERILANAKQAVEAGLAQNDSQQVYELAERVCGVTELAHDMWPRLVDVVKALEEAEGLGMCACYYREWLGPNSPRHDAECLFRVLDRWQLRGVWRGEGEDAAQ